MRSLRRILPLLLGILALAGTFFASPFTAPAMAQPEFPALTGRVVDTADIIPADVEAQLTAKLEALETQTQRQLVVTTVPDLQGYDISDYGYQLGRAWGLGDAERNDGALLIVAPNDRKVRIEVGYGLEGYLTDAYSSFIIQDVIIPRFRDGDFPAGISNGTDAIISLLELPPEEAARINQEAAEAQSSDGGFPFGFLIWVGFMFFFFVLPMIRGASRKRRYRSKGKGPWGKRRDGDDDDDDSGFGGVVGNIILWEIGSAIARGAMSGGSGGSSWGGGGGGGFGGGFSGGGGSFGGGGASGGW